jgi:hypothetical protein
MVVYEHLNLAFKLLDNVTTLIAEHADLFLEIFDLRFKS